MAQDFGDDMGNALLNFVTRQTENYLRFGRGRERAFDWWQRHYKKEGNTPEAAKAMAEKQSSREQVVVPFGTSEEAAYYAQVCRENGTYAAAYIRQRFRRPAAPRPKTQVPVSAEPNGNLIVELVHRIFRRFRFQIEYHAVFVLSRVVVSRHIHDSFPSTRQAL